MKSLRYMEELSSTKVLQEVSAKLPSYLGNKWCRYAREVQKKSDDIVSFHHLAEYKGESLNKNLLQGPDLTNTLTGVLTRFRQEPIGFMCDIEAMFHQVKVAEEHRDMLRFLWWESGDISREPVEYRMTVHLFGATLLPRVCEFCA